MIIDRKQVKWSLTIAAFGVLSLFAYLIYASFSINGARGGSFVGLTYGSAAAGIFVFECLLSFRKKFRASLTGGGAQIWLRAHIWLGILTVPLALMHSGFRWGTGLAAGLMWLLSIVVLSGIAGVGFQNYLPRRMKELVEEETIFEQIPQVIADLRDEADAEIAPLIGDLRTAKQSPAYARYHARRRDRNRAAGSGLLVIDDLSVDTKGVLRRRYEGEIRPYLTDKPPAVCAGFFGTRDLARAYFDGLSTGMPAPVRDTLGILAQICEQRRQLAVQRKMHNWLHGWLIVHVPLSFALLVLTAVHSVLALRY